MKRIKINLPDKFIYSAKLQVRIADVASGFHLGNHMLISYLTESMLLCFRHFGFPKADMDGLVTINVDLAIVYKSESSHGDVLKIDVAVGNFSRSGCDFYFKVTNENTGKVAADAKMGMLFFDYTSKKVADMPKKFRDTFECFKI